MAKTNAAIRSHIDAIIDTRRNKIPALARDVLSRAMKLGTGTFRSVNHDSLKVVISWPVVKRGYDWKRIAKRMQTKYEISDREMQTLMRQNQSSRFPGQKIMVTVAADDMVPANAKARAI